MSKKYFRDGSDFVELVFGFGSCFATDRITVDGCLVGYMYREEPDDKFDSGWRFFSGTESQDYLENPKNLGIYNVNTIANYDPAITPYLDAPAGTELVRNGEHFKIEKSR